VRPFFFVLFFCLPTDCFCSIDYLSFFSLVKKVKLFVSSCLHCKESTVSVSFFNDSSACSYRKDLTCFLVSVSGQSYFVKVKKNGFPWEVQCVVTFFLKARRHCKSNLKDGILLLSDNDRVRIQCILPLWIGVLPLDKSSDICFLTNIDQFTKKPKKNVYCLLEEIFKKNSSCIGFQLMRVAPGKTLSVLIKCAKTGNQHEQDIAERASTSLVKAYQVLSQIDCSHGDLYPENCFFDETSRIFSLIDPADKHFDDLTCILKTCARSLFHPNLPFMREVMLAALKVKKQKKCSNRLFRDLIALALKSATYNSLDLTYSPSVRRFVVAFLLPLRQFFDLARVTSNISQNYFDKGSDCLQIHHAITDLLCCESLPFKYKSLIKMKRPNCNWKPNADIFDVSAHLPASPLKD
jgi:hypothetical protein